MKKETPLQNRVRELRARLGIRQADLAREIGVTRQTILAIEKGRLNPSILICLKMGRILREPVDYIFYLTPGWELTQESPEEMGDDAEDVVSAVEDETVEEEPAPIGSGTVQEEAVSTSGRLEHTSDQAYDYERDAEATSFDEEDGDGSTNGWEPEAELAPTVESTDESHVTNQTGQVAWDFS